MCGVHKGKCEKLTNIRNGFITIAQKVYNKRDANPRTFPQIMTVTVLKTRKYCT